MRRNKALSIFLILLALVFAYSVYKFFTTHEYKETTEYTAFKGEARTNPLYAARLFLRQMGIPAENKDNLQSVGETLPDTHTAMILDTRRSTLSLKKAEQLLAWVRDGGHLITRSRVDNELMEYFYVLDEDEDESDNDEDQSEDENSEEYSADTAGENEADGDGHDSDDSDKSADNSPAENYCPNNSGDYFYERITDDLADENIVSRDPLQSVLGVLVMEGIYLDRGYDDNDENDENNEQPVFSWLQSNPDHVEYDIALPEVDKLLTLALDNYFYALYTPYDKAENRSEQDYSVLIRNEPFLLHRKVGKGHITLVSDLSIFENQLLRYADNAEILWQLLHSDNRQPNAVWLFHNDEMPNLFVLMWKYGWMVMLSLAALLLFWLYQSLHRFGPIIPKQALARRRLLEHIDASGHYYWKTGDKQRLIDSTRKALNQRIAQLHPGWHNSNPDEKIQHLVELTHHNEAAIKHLLFTANADNTTRDDAFVKLINDLETLRKNL